MPSQLLPVGSVVRLAGADTLVMVMGFAPRFDGGTADYLGVVYPQGLVSDDAALAFDADAIAELVHRGHWDDEAEAGLAAVRRFRAAADDVERQLDEFIATLTPEHVRELREEYLFDALDDEPEPDFFDDLDDEPEPDFPDEGSLA